MKFFSALMILFILLPVCLFSEIYIWTDANGVKHVSDTPPRQSEIVKDYQSMESSPVPPPKTVQPDKQDTASTEINEPTQSREVAMFTLPGNVDCEKARQWFNSHNVAFQEFDINSSETIKSAYKELNGKGIPLIVINDQTVNGWDETRVKTLLNLK